jgi:hypothetical protein
MTNETKKQAQIIFDAINAMIVAYEQMHGVENDELSSIIYSVHTIMSIDEFTDAEVLETCFSCLQMATDSFANKS